MKKIFIVLLTLLIVVSLSGCKQEKNNVPEIIEYKKVDEIFKRVFDAGTYNYLDYDIIGIFLCPDYYNVFTKLCYDLTYLLKLRF